MLGKKTKQQPITSLFNAVLLLFLVVRATLFMLVQPTNDAANTYLSLILSSYPTSGFVAMIVVALAIILWGAELLRMFWNFFMTNMFKLRTLTYQEALAITLIIAVVFGS
ncbi:MAG: hypothetical protein AAB870_00050 [Patescibacteria group bacterium]|mgnify:CR=1